MCNQMPMDVKKFHQPYDFSSTYQIRVAYLCMEFAVDQALKIFSGGLGFLAGSHMRSAYDLKQNLIGIGILWKYGYYDQERKRDHGMDVLFMERHYNFLQDLDITFEISVDKHPVKVKAWYLAPEVFGTAPIFLLSTDLPENDYLAQTICHRLYDSDTAAKIAQYILLGQGAMKLMETIDYKAEKVHLNEAHGLPAIFYDYYQHKSIEKTRKRFVFTTHTPVEAGNEIHDIQFLKKMGFFHDIALEEVRSITGEHGDTFNMTLGGLRLSGRANGVSKMHGKVARHMWGSYHDISHIQHVTNAQHAGYWTDEHLKLHAASGDLSALANRKRALKRRLFEEVADQTGKLFREDVLTIVWARRYAPYKRADFLTLDNEKFLDLLSNQQYPVQIIWAGKPYPMDYGSITTFNKLVQWSKQFPNVAVLVRYEMRLSRLLKHGADIWLNTPRVTREASGTSGMTAAMNAAVNFTTFDGWIPEFARHGINAFVIGKFDAKAGVAEQDQHDVQSAYKTLHEEILPIYYERPMNWMGIVHQSMKDVLPYFDSSRMAHEYYTKLYR